MSEAMTKEQLIQALEEATEGSRELDAQIHLAAGLYDRMRFEASDQLVIGEIYRDGSHALDVVGKNGGRVGYTERPPRYTTSLDAAMTLQSEGWTPSISLPPDFRAEVRLFRHAIGMNVHDAVKLDIVVQAATGPLALCSAFIRARPA